jgi:serine/threonine-protein kinase
LVHRDVTPHNIFITYDGAVRLMDFGIAKFSDANSHTVSGTFKGKARYASPEQLSGKGIDRRVDIFAVGIMAFEVVAKRRYWEDAESVRSRFAYGSPGYPLCAETRPM